MKIRASVGTLAILGVKRVKLNANPTTLCLMVNERCMYNCAYCPQAKNSRGSPGNLSHVVWPEIEWETLKIAMLQNTTLYKRICFQVVNRSHFFTNLMFFLKDIKKPFEEYKLSVPVSVSVRLQSIEKLKEFFDAGAQRVGLSLDVASESYFPKLRGGDFKKCLDFILNASRQFPGRITTHLIVGLWERDIELYNLMKLFSDNGITVGLFSFTLVKGTRLETLKPLSLTRYRRIQLLRYLLFKGVDFKPLFDENGEIASISPAVAGEVLKDPAIFMTSGCPNCNRPYYNESPAGPIFNYPFVPDKDALTGIVGTFIEEISENEIRFKT
jgi:biotin synthase